MSVVSICLQTSSLCPNYISQKIKTLVYPPRDFSIWGFIPLRGSPLVRWVELGLHPPMFIIVSEIHRFQPIFHCKSLLRGNLFFLIYAESSGACNHGLV